MVDISKVVGNNLKNFRVETKMSLDAVSELTGISKSMLSEMEKGSKSPTITLLWKLCEGLNITIEELLRIPTPAVSCQRAEGMEHYSLGEGVDYRILFPFTPEDKLEFYQQRLAPHTSKKDSRHSASVTEFVIVTKGEYHIKINDEVFQLSQGDTIQFVGNCEHAYHNESDEDAEAIIVMAHKIG